MTAARGRTGLRAMVFAASAFGVVLFFAALLVGLGLANRRARAVYGRMGRWLVLTPIWVAGLVFCFESLTRLLPANL